MNRLSVLTTLLLTLPLQAQPSKTIFFPVTPAPAPVQPAPGAAQKLDQSQLFVFRSTVKCIVVCSPVGIVKVSTDPGPLRVRARFTDGTGQYETKNYTEKFVFTVEGVATGLCEMIIIPEGAGEGDVIRKAFQVTAGPGPGPDPTPPDPTPPVPVTDPFLKTLQAAYAANKEPDKAATADFLRGIYKVMTPLVLDPVQYPTVASIMKRIKDIEGVPGLGIDVFDANGKLVSSKLVNVRQAIGAELNKLLPATLDPAARALISQQFARMAAALGTLK